VEANSSPEEKIMKKLTSLMLGMALVLGTAALSFAAQEKAADSNKAASTTTTTKKMKKHHKKGAKKQNASATSSAKPAPAK
jgi:Spy/CpxP family protein refolding chaperone